MLKNPKLRILSFFIIAIVISNIFRFDLFQIRETILNFPFWIIIALSFLGASGLIIGALISKKSLKKYKKENYSVFGTSRKWSLIMLFTPIALFTIIGFDNNRNLNTHVYGFLISFGALLYGFSEEIGWRGYLQDELANVNEWKRGIFIGVLWYVWHLTFLNNQDIMSNLQFLGWMILGSFGLGKVIDSTKSTLSVSCFHMIINVLMFNPFLRDEGIVSSKLVYLCIASIIIWIIIMKKWEKEINTKLHEKT